MRLYKGCSADPHRNKIDAGCGVEARCTPPFQIKMSSITPAEKFAIESYLNHVFPDREMMNYFFDCLRFRRYTFWYGTGNNGKTAFANIFSRCYEFDVEHEEDNDIPVYKNRSEYFWSAVYPIIFEQKDMRSFPLTHEQVKALPWYAYLRERMSSIIAGSAPIEMPKKSRELVEKMKAAAAAAESLFAKDKIDSTKKPVLNIAEEVSKIVEPIKDQEKTKNTIVYKNLPVAAPASKPEKRPSEPVDEPAEDAWVYADIVIHLRKPGAQPDDILTVSPDPESDNFIVSFEQPAHESWITLYMPANKLNSYLSAFFSSATWDRNPYSTVEFNVPFFPVMTVDQEDAFDYATRNLLPQIAFHLDDWPVLTEFADE